MKVSQNLFASALLDASAAIPDGLSDADARPAGRRFNVYRNNVVVSLTQALHTAFPATASLLGKANMDGLSGQYLRQTPPSSPLLMFYGDRFPDFLASVPQLAKMGYLPDLARMELALRRAYHAADADPIAAQTLATLGPEELMATRLSLAPAVHVLPSRWPIHDIWRLGTEPDAPKPRATAQDILITRPEFDPLATVLPPGGASWIKAILGGHSIGEAHEQATENQPDFDLGATLTLMLQGNAIISLTTKG
ncbi:DNA-binding domain-containing protein [Aliisedimentitalea scapharcae]|uniref:DNA-binding domain-containing protein n=1 Tax=Aliisedimentitalea scapharcae TaxID=1524259 RepID=A0ABZ2XVM3_9RHOB